MNRSLGMPIIRGRSRRRGQRGSRGQGRSRVRDTRKCKSRNRDRVRNRTRDRSGLGALGKGGRRRSSSLKSRIRDKGQAGVRGWDIFPGCHNGLTAALCSSCVPIVHVNGITKLFFRSCS